MHRASFSARGVTLIDTLVGVALMTVVFVGITGVFSLSIDVVMNNKSRIGALALANESMEYLRSLPYDSVGTVGGIPSGGIAQEEEISLNNVTYTRHILVRYLDKAEDGLAGDDENGVIADVKQAKVSVSWEYRGQTRTISLVSEFAPPGVESEVPGGTISIAVVDSVAAALSGASVRIVNDSVLPAIDVTSSSDASGRVTFIGAPASSGYEITVSKTGYSTAQTYSTSASLTNPSPGHLTVSDGQTTEATFAIDTVGTITIRTFKQIYPATWSDSFASDAKIATSTNVEISDGDVRLVAGESSGSVTSETVQPAYLSRWTSASWSEATSTGNIIRHRVYVGSTIVPDTDLPGNSAGFTESPINLGSLSTSTYPLLVLTADLLGDGDGGMPVLHSWQIDYEEGPEPLPSISYALRGAKTIGTDSSGDPVYKYNNTGSSGLDASVTLTDMEWDTYTLEVPASSGYDIVESCMPQPNTLAPGQSITTNLYLETHTSNSLLVDVRTSDGTPISDATAVLSRDSFEANDITGSCGQVFFSDLSEGTITLGTTYSVELTAPGYQSYSIAEVEVSGASRLSVVLTP